MYLIGSLLLALAITVFAVSKIATMLHAKKPGMERILLASLVGGIAAFATLVGLSAFVKDIDPMVLMIVSIFAMFLVSTVAFKSINQLTWSGAITTNIANIAMVLITGTAAVVLNGVSIDKAIKSAQNAFHTNTNIVEDIATGNTDVLSAIEQNSQQQNAEDVVDEEFVDEDLDPTFKEIDLLPAGTVKEIEAKKNVVYKAPKFHVISIGNIRSAVGKTIRIQNKSGNSIEGALKNIRANDAIVEQRINGGLAITPISLTKIEKLEVYR